MRTVLVMAYCISPVRGSEYSVGWNYVVEMSKSNKLIVLCGAAGEHLGDFEELDGVNGLPNVTFVKIEPNRMTGYINFLNKKNIFNYAFYVAYGLWHRQAYQIAKRICDEQRVDIVHYLCPIGYREPGFLWKLDLPYIWGPIGGVQNRPLDLVYSKSRKEWALAAAKSIVNNIQFNTSRRVKAALHRADVLLSSTSDVRSKILKRYGIESIVMAENAIHSSLYGNRQVVKYSLDEVFKIIWIGRLDNNKSLDLLIQGLSKVARQSWHLQVIGEGPNKDSLVDLSVSLGVANQIVFAGKLPRTEVLARIQDSHLHVITSMQEGNPTTIWECMSFGVPTLSLDHCGMHDVICDRCGVRVPISSYSRTVDDIGSRLADLMTKDGHIEDLSLGVSQCFEKFTWKARKNIWEHYYDDAVRVWSEGR